MIRLNKELCYKTIINERNSPITTAIIILEEIINNYQLKVISNPNNSEMKTLSSLNNGWITSYKYFEKKLSFKRYKARYALLKLEEYSLIIRERAFDRINSNNKRGGSEIRLILNLENIQPLLF